MLIGQTIIGVIIALITTFFIFLGKLPIRANIKHSIEHLRWGRWVKRTKEPVKFWTWIVISYLFALAFLVVGITY